MKKRLFVLLSIILIGSLVAACQPAEEAVVEEAEEAVVEEVEEAAEEKELTIAFVVMQTGNVYFDASDKGADEAAAELGVKLIKTGPASMDVAEQIEIIDSLIAQKVDAIGVSAIDPNALVPVGKKAMEAGIKFYTWDSPVSVEGRLVHTDAASPEDIGRIQVQMLGEMIDYEGDVAIISSGATNENSNLWIGWMEEEFKDPKYENMKLVATVYGDDDTQKSYNEAQALLKTYPDLKGIISPTTVGVAAAGKFLQDEGLCGEVALTGLGLPSEMAEYIRNGCCEAMALWNPIDQGYLGVYMGYALATGELTPAAGETFDAGRLGELEVVDIGDGNLIIFQGLPFVFDADNIDDWADVY